MKRIDKKEKKIEKISKRKIFCIRLKSTATTIKKESNQAEKTTPTHLHNPGDLELSNEYILSLSISNRGNPPFLSFSPSHCKALMVMSD